jgi:PleD family two-component response regulator
MPTTTGQSSKQSDQPFGDRSILLVSDSERHGATIHRALQQHGFSIDYAGDYSQLDARLNQQKYDVVLLEVTGEHAVEPAVAAALRVKRVDARQFVGYLADPILETSGLTGDAVLPRSATKLPDALRHYIADD